MFQNLLESIKSERHLSFSNWRYRLLHWFFGINPASPEESNLPKFFYSHFCPLFHFTNLVAIFSPIILAWKILWFVSGLIISGCMLTEPYVAYGVGKIVDFIVRLMPKAAPAKELSEEEDAAYRRQRHLADLRKETWGWYEHMKYQGRLNELDYEYFCAVTACFLEEDEEGRDIFDKLIARYKLRDKQREGLAARRKAWILFWVNFSQVFIKWGLNIGYVGLAALILYLSFTFGPPLIFGTITLIYNIGVFFGTIDFFNILYWSAIWTFRILTPVAILALITIVIARRKDKVADALIMTFGPLVVLGSAIHACGSYIATSWENAFEFIRMFYEESCPPIKIVSQVEEE